MSKFPYVPFIFPVLSCVRQSLPPVQTRTTVPQTVQLHDSLPALGISCGQTQILAVQLSRLSLVADSALSLSEILISPKRLSFCPERLQSSSIFIGLRKVRRFYSTVLSSARCPHHTSFLTMSLYAVVCSHLVLLTLGRHSCVLSGGVYPVVLGDALPEREPLTRAPWLLPPIERSASCCVCCSVPTQLTRSTDVRVVI